MSNYLIRASQQNVHDLVVYELFDILKLFTTAEDFHRVTNLK